MIIQKCKIENVGPDTWLLFPLVNLPWVAPILQGPHLSTISNTCLNIKHLVYIKSTVPDEGRIQLNYLYLKLAYIPTPCQWWPSTPLCTFSGNSSAHLFLLPALLWVPASAEFSHIEDVHSPLEGTTPFPNHNTLIIWILKYLKQKNYALSSCFTERLGHWRRFNMTAIETNWVLNILPRFSTTIPQVISNGCFSPWRQLLTMLFHTFPFPLRIFPTSCWCLMHNSLIISTFR